MLARIISILIGYVCGQFLTGFLVGKKQHVDLRKVGSGNVGTTNTYRNLGPKAGLLTFLGDVFKVVLAVVIVWLLFRSNADVNVRVLGYYAALGSILGHNFPVFMKFKGGKGIACTAGLMVALCPICIPVCLAIFLLVVLSVHYVSLGSLLVCLSLLIQVLAYGQMGLLGVSGTDLIEVYVLVAIVAVLGIVRHHSNIKRLMSGTENKFYFKPKAQQE
jgi:glycerol-3-phosphate acyltransferase PlsY